MKYIQATWERDEEDVYEPHIAEKDLTEVEPDVNLPDSVTRDSVELPQLSEPHVARHYTRLSQMNYGIENGPYPLGSCSMKYNPKYPLSLWGDANNVVHPDRDSETVQGTLEIQHRLQEALKVMGGMDEVSLQPPAGAAGEFAGILIAKAYHRDNGDERSEVIIPDTAHGTNPATAAMAGYDVVEIESNDKGCMDVEALRAAVSEETAALMLTNPNTVGVFEDDIEEIAEIVHDVGGLLYYDGANLNATLGRVRPGDMDYDIMHFNVHKTFSQPHGGGGPGAGPIGVKEKLAEYLPTPHVRKTDEGEYERYEPDKTIGKVHGFHGNWLVHLWVWSYIYRLGESGMRDITNKAVLNANYLGEKIDLDIPYKPWFHEFVATAQPHDASDFGKRMLDYGVHPPTTKFPLIVSQALMTEPTEMEAKDSLDDLAYAMNEVNKEDEETLAASPRNTSVNRVDQTTADRNPTLSWHAMSD